MPRIDPLQLLRCLSVLLSPSGGIKSKEEVQRLASLMTKFSKKLVSKCIYIQILKTTEPELLGMFMSAGGWNLIHMWLSDAIVAKNWPLIQELLELLLFCPVDVERLRINNCPKLIKGLQKDGSTSEVRTLATKLVEQWLKIVKGGSPAQSSNSVEPGKSVCGSLPESVNSSDPSTQIVKSSTEIVPSEAPSESISSISSKPNVKIEESVVTSANVLIEPDEEVKGEKGEIKKVEEAETKAEEKVGADVISEVAMGHDGSADNGMIQEKDVDKESVTEVKAVASNGPPEEVATSEDSGEEVGAWNGPVGQLPVYKITIRDGKQVLAKVCSGDRTNKKSSDVPSPTSADPPKSSISKTSVSLSEDEIVKEVNSEVKPNDAKISVSAKPKLEKKDTSELSKSKKNSQKKGKEGHSSIKTPDKKSKHSESNKEKSKETSKDKTKEKKDKHKEKENNKLKEKKPLLVLDKVQMEKDKATLAKLIPPTISKLGKIPKVKKSEDGSKPSEMKKEDEVKKSENKKPHPVAEVKKSPVPLVEPKKSSISIEVRRNDGERPKTVKKFHSKFRSTGLEEEVKPPPSRPVKKVPPPLPEKKPIKFPTLKRPSPPRDVPVPVPEKKLKPLIPEIIPEESKKAEKNGSIKLIPPRPKPCFLQESDMFMDALTASSLKKEPKKRKRRFSLSKDDKKEANSKEETTPPSSPPADELKSPPVVKPTLKFYQDTLEAEEERVDEEESGEKENQDEGSVHPKDEDGNAENESLEPEEKLRRLSGEEAPEGMSPNREAPKTQRAPGGVLTYAKVRTGPKKVVRWKPEKELEVIRYFELDETERVNVTKTFLDMKQMERTHEREAFMLARKLPQDDNMEEKTRWLPLIPIDLPPSLAEPGKLSREKDIQYAREKATLQAIYFNRAMIPDSPAEPDMEIHATTDPTPIPLDDVTGNADSVNDFQDTPWPDPKPMLRPQSPPQQFPVQQQPQYPSYPSPSYNSPPMYPNQPVMANNMPGPGPVSIMHPNPMNTGSGDWRTGDGKIIAMNDMSPPMDMYNQGMPPINPNMGMPMNMNMNMGIPSNMGPGMPPDMNFNMMGGEDMNQFPPQGYQMGGPPNMFNYRGGRGPGMGMGNGPMRGGRGNRGGGPWFRPMGNGGGNWQGGGRGGRGGNWGGPSRTICKHFRSGFCRQAEKCPYLHPGVNGPPQF